MVKCLCDICKENEAKKQFKIKGRDREYRTGNFWVEYAIIDICENCYDKLLSLVNKEFEKEFANMLNEYINKDK